MFFLKVFSDDVRLTLATTKVSSRVFGQLVLVAWAPSPERIALDILVQHLVRIELWTVARQKEKTNARSIALQPPVDLA